MDDWSGTLLERIARARSDIESRFSSPQWNFHNEDTSPEDEETDGTEKPSIDGLAPIDSSGRPYGEPPILDYEEIITDIERAERQAKPLFREDPNKNMKFVDLQIEAHLLSEYLLWRDLCDQWEMPRWQENDAGKQFYKGLGEEIFKDFKEVEDEEFALLNTASDLQRWEFQYLDNDGGTTRIESELAEGNDIFWCDEARARYLHLAPTGNELFRWESQYLDNDGGTTKIVEYLVEGVDIFWSEAAEKKYEKLKEVAAELRKKENRSGAVPPTIRPPLDWDKVRAKVTEPPDFDYEHFILKVLPSDLRFGKLFPGSRQEDYQKRFNYRDYKTEREIVWMYIERVKALKAEDEKKADNATKQLEEGARNAGDAREMRLAHRANSMFYDGLLNELQTDFKQSEEKEVALYKQAGNLGKWEYTFLDQDGDTKEVQKTLRKLENNGRVFWCLEAIIHYGHLSRSRAFRERAKMEKQKWEKSVKEAAEAAKKAEEAAKQAQKNASEQLNETVQVTEDADESSEYDSDVACAAWPVDGVEPACE